MLWRWSQRSGLGFNALRELDSTGRQEPKAVVPVRLIGFSVNWQAQVRAAAASWAQEGIRGKKALTARDAARVEEAFAARLAERQVTQLSFTSACWPETMHASNGWLPEMSPASRLRKGRIRLLKKCSPQDSTSFTSRPWNRAL